MRKATKIWLIVAVVLLLVGCLLFSWLLRTIEGDWSRLSTDRYETHTTVVDNTFRHIAVDTTTADILFAESDDGTCRVECSESEQEPHLVTVENDTLIVRVQTQPTAVGFLDRVGVHLGSPKITLYLPKTEYDTLTIHGTTGRVEIPNAFSFGDIDLSLTTGNVALCASADGAIHVKATTGSIRAETLSAASLDLSVTTGGVVITEVSCEKDVTVNVSTGRAHLTDVACRNLISHGNTGDLLLTRTVATESFRLERSTGDILFDRCDAAEIEAETDTGDIEGSLLSEKVFLTETDTGHVSVPPTLTGGRCEVSTDTGDIRLVLCR